VNCPELFKTLFESADGFRFDTCGLTRSVFIQDDVEDWQIQSAQMATIYERSYPTISASTASDSNSGFLINREKSKEITCVDDVGSSQDIYARRAINHVQLFNLTTPTEAQDRYPLYPRAWCFQERFLARRVLHFLSYELVFECCSVQRCECDRIAQEYGFSLKRDFMEARGAQIDPSEFHLSSTHSPQQVWGTLSRITARNSSRSPTTNFPPSLESLAACLLQP
jgi:hypothetical protein